MKGAKVGCFSRQKKGVEDPSMARFQDATQPLPIQRLRRVPCPYRCPFAEIRRSRVLPNALK